MFMYFPTNYVWSMAVVATLNNGGLIDDFLAKTKDMRLDGVVERITVPFLVTHGAGDRQISVDYAYQEYAAAVNSPKRELRVFTQAEGGAEHVGLDNQRYVAQWTADWIAETFTELDQRR